MPLHRSYSRPELGREAEATAAPSIASLIQSRSLPPFPKIPQIDPARGTRGPEKETTTWFAVLAFLGDPKPSNTKRTRPFEPLSKRQKGSGAPTQTLLKGRGRGVVAAGLVETGIVWPLDP